MLTSSELDEMRATSKAAMPATGTITRPAGTPVFDPATGQYTTPTPTNVYTGVMRVRTLHTQDMAVIVGGLHEALTRYVVTVPWNAGPIVVDDFVTVTSGTDAHLVGRPLRVTDVNYSEFLIDRRLVVEDAQQP